MKNSKLNSLFKLVWIVVGIIAIIFAVVFVLYIFQWWIAIDTVNDAVSSLGTVSY